MRRHVLLLLLFCLCTLPAQAQPGKGGPPSGEKVMGTVRVQLLTGGHEEPIVGVFFKKDDKEIVTVGGNAIQVWDVASGKRLRKILLPLWLSTQVVDAAALSPDGKTIAVSILPANHQVTLVNLENGRIVNLWKTAGLGLHSFASLAFSPSGDRLAVSDGGTVRIFPKMDQLWDNNILWNKAGGLLENKIPTYFTSWAYPAQKKQIFQIQFSPDGQHVAAVLGQFGSEAVIFDASAAAAGKDGAAVKATGGKDYLFSLAWNPDSTVLYGGGHGAPGGIRAFDVSGKELEHFNPVPKPGANPKPTKVDWMSGNCQIASLHPLDANTLLVNGTVRTKGNQVGNIGASVLNLKTGDFEKRLLLPELVERLSLTAVAHDKKLAVTTVNCGRDLLLWEIATGKVVREIKSQAKTPVRVGWLKDKNRYVLAWGYGTDAAHKDFGKFTRAFDLEKLKFVEDNKFDAANYTGRLHQIGPWSAKYKIGVGRTQVGIYKNGKEIDHVLAPDIGIPAFTLVPGGKDNPYLSFDAYTWLNLYDPVAKKAIWGGLPHFPATLDIAPSPDGKYLAVATGTQRIVILGTTDGGKAWPRKMLELFVTDQDWVVWHDGYYAASPGGEQLMGWSHFHYNLKQATFHPASRFRKNFYRPDVFKCLLQEGGWGKAWETANTALGKPKEKQLNLGDMLPPSVFLDKIETGSLPKVTIHASAVANQANDLITDMELLADGRPLFGAAGLKEFTTPLKEAKAMFTVELPPGSSKLMVRVHSQKTWSVSSGAPVAFALAPGVEPKFSKAKMHILAIGSSEYKNYPGLNLPSPAKDAKEIALAMPKHCGPPLYSPGTSHTFLGKGAVSPAIYQAIKDLGQQVKAEDLAVLYFGGHGLKDKNGGLFLLTHDTDMDKLDTTALSGKKLRDELAKVPCRVILILDACHSGALGPKQPTPLAKTKPVTDDLIRDLTDDDCGVVVWCSALGHQKAQVDDKAGHGLFTLSLLKALDSQKGAGANPFDNKVYLHHLHTYVFDRVQYESGQRQHPSLNIPWTVESFALVQRPGG